MKLLKTIEGVSAPPEFSRDGRYLAYKQDGKWRVFDGDLFITVFEAKLFVFAWDSRHCLYVDKDSRLIFFDLEKKNIIRSLYFGVDIVSVKYSTDFIVYKFSFGLGRKEICGVYDLARGRNLQFLQDFECVFTNQATVMIVGSLVNQYHALRPLVISGSLPELFSKKLTCAADAKIFFSVDGHTLTHIIPQNNIIFTKVVTRLPTDRGAFTISGDGKRIATLKAQTLCLYSSMWSKQHEDVGNPFTRRIVSCVYQTLTHKGLPRELIYRVLSELDFNLLDKCRALAEGGTDLVVLRPSERT